MKSKILFLASVLFVVAVAAGLRWRAVELLPIDYDEDDYLGAAIHYANAIRAGDVEEIIDYEFNFEHPPLIKLAYGLAILPYPELPPMAEKSASAPIAESLPEPHFHIARTQSALFSTLQVLVLALLNPLSGLFLAINTWQIKYTSQIMLEALPSLTSLLAVYFYAKSNTKWNYWLLLSSISFGLTVAAKYPYAIVGIAILMDWWMFVKAKVEPGRPRLNTIWLKHILLWGMLAVLAFIIANPRLWADPVSRLIQTLQFHWGYAHSEHVQQVGYPPWQPLVWLFRSVPWHPGIFLVSIDFFITILAFLGFRRTWEKQRVFALWLLIAIVFLLLWSTKWPQYILILTAPLSLSAVEGFQGWIWEPIRGLLTRPIRINKPEWSKRTFSGLRAALPWLLPGAIVLGLIAAYPMLFQTAMALTDFSATAIKDGLNGGVWREAWLGLTGQVEPVIANIFNPSLSRQVHYAGPSLLVQLISGAAAELLVFSCMWTGLAVLAQTTLGLAAALILGRVGVRFKGWWQAIYILPWAIPEFVGALIWAQVFDPRFGWFSQGRTWAETADYPGAVNFVTGWQENPSYALVVLLITVTWYGFPFMMLAATAGLKMIPVEVYDAAAIDGAGAWSTFQLVTWPMLMPLLVPAIIIRSIFSFNQFYIFYVLNPPYPVATLSITSFFFFDQLGQYGVSAAINLFTVLALVVLIWWFNRWSKAAEGVTYA